MSKEFVTNVSGTGSSFRISFSEEKPEQKVSKLTLSSDFTHSFEESYEGEDDVLVVDIDYGGGNEVENEKESDSSRSSSLSNSIKKEKPKFGLRRFKSVEEIIEVSPTKGKRKLKKTVSDYGSRYKGLEKKEAKLTLSADFTHSWEENFEEDGEVLIVDIDYSKGEERKTDQSIEDNVFSASDNFGRMDTRNENGFRKYSSHEDIRSPSYKHRELERSASGYEITFINENSDERKKLSLSADLVSSSEEILEPTEEDTQQPVKDKEKVDDKEFFNVKQNYVTSTPQKSSKSMQLHTDAYTQGALFFEEKPEPKAVGHDEVNPDCVDNSEADSAHVEVDLVINKSINTEWDNNDYAGEEEEILPVQMKEDESSMNIEQEEVESDVKIDLDDILIIDIASNDQKSVSKMADEANPSETNGDYFHEMEIGKNGTPKRAEVYIYSLNQNESDADGLDGNGAPNVSQKEESVWSKPADENVTPAGEKWDDDDGQFGKEQNDEGQNDEVRNNDEQNTSPYSGVSVDEDSSTLLQKADASDIGDKIRLLDLATTDGKNAKESIEENENQNNLPDSYLIKMDQKNEEEVIQREEDINPNLDDSESLSNGSKIGNDNVTDSEASKVDASKHDDKSKEIDDGTNTRQSESMKSKKFFKMIVISEVETDNSDDDVGREGADEEANECEYTFPMPYRMDLMNEINEDENEDSACGDDDDTEHAPLEDDNTPNEVGNEGEETFIWRAWSGLWRFRIMSTIFSGFSKGKSPNEFDQGPIPNGACKTADDDDDDLISLAQGTTSLPKHVNKVYRLKDIHHGRRILTETIRIFLQQEDILPLV